MTDKTTGRQKNMGEQFVFLLVLLSTLLAGVYLLVPDYRIQVAMIIGIIGAITYVLSLIYPEEVKCYIGNADFLPPCIIIFIVTGLILGITFFFKMSCTLYFLYGLLFAFILYIPLAIRNYPTIHGEIWSIFIAMLFLGFGVAGLVNGTIGVKEADTRQETITDKTMSSRGFCAIYTDGTRYTVSKNQWSEYAIGDSIEVTEYEGILQMNWCEIK